jgi:Glycosyl hydrolases family 16
MAYRKHAFQFGFDEVSSRSSTDEETAHLNPVAEDDEEDYGDEEVSSFENAYAPGPESPYLIPTSPSTISYSPSISRRYSSHYSSEPTDAYPDEGDSTSSGYNFRDHLKRPGTPATRYTRRFQTRLVTEELPKPWLTERDTREKWVTLLPYLGMCLGLGVAIYLGYSGWASVETHNYCLVYQDNFDTFNTSIWNHEVQIGGFGTGEFEWTTADPANSYVQNNTLVIMPTLTDQGVLTDAQVSNGYTLNLTADGTCTSDEEEACVAISNSTAQTIINPVRSARLSTKGSRWIKYGKVEVVAKLPVGDWLWPAIWMMPVNDTYGPWPASGEIDICESRGNAINYPQGGVNTYSSTLHWGNSTSQLKD